MNYALRIMNYFVSLQQICEKVLMKLYTDEELAEILNQELFHQISEAADRLGVECYVVGGYVRDIFLERPSNDIDVVVVGSGISVAQELKRMLGRKAHLSVFKNFGTAQVKIRRQESGVRRQESGVRRQENTPATDSSLQGNLLSPDSCLLTPDSRLLSPVSEITRDELLNQGHSLQTITALIKRGLLETYEQEVGRLNHGGEPHLDKIQPLSPVQQDAYNQIQFSFLKKNVTLLHGVTSS
jgi:primosomal protein N'